MAAATLLTLLARMLWVAQEATHGTVSLESRGSHLCLSSSLTGTVNMMPPLAKLRGGRPSDDGRPSDQRKKIRTSKDEQEKAELQAKLIRSEDQLQKLILLNLGYVDDSPYLVYDQRRDQDFEFLAVLWNTSCSGSIDANQTTVRLPEGAKLLGGNELLIRECYRDVKDIIAMNFGLDPKTLKPRENRTSFETMIITGNPGIGKSCFALYLLLYILQTGESVYYQRGDDHFHFKEGTWFRVKNAAICRESILFKHGGWYLCDLNAEVSTYFCAGYTKNIIISYPKQRVFKTLLKDGRAKRFFMPVWTDEEMAIFQELHKTRLDAAVAQQTIETWGNIPRMLLESSNSTLIREIQKFTREVQKFTSIGDLDDKVRAVYDQDFDLPSNLVHLVPSPTYDSVKAQICSEHAKVLISKWMIKRDLDMALKVAFSQPYSDRVLSNGILFEFLSHPVLRKEGKRKARRLGEGHDDSTLNEIELMRSKLVEFSGGPESLNRHLQNRTYYKPLSKTFLCVDALMLSETPGELYLFRITTAKQHPVLYGPLYDILANITVLNKVRKANLIFVLPEVRANTAGWQHAQTLSIETEPSKQRGSLEDLGIELVQSVMFLSEGDARECVGGLDLSLEG
mmetsp:Transcript_3005/g.10153  ORF Transcript_3005/g.10153 Transcript_3005/m.10153 type:complete len:625 (-) Transcript_3005:133-2007(-)